MNSKIKQTVRALAAFISCLVLTAQAAEEGLVAHFTFDDATQFGYDRIQKSAIGTIYNTSHDSTVTPAAPTSCDAPIVRGMKISTGWWHNTYMKVPGTSFGSAQGIPSGSSPVTYSLWVNPATKWQSGGSLGLGTQCILLRRANDYGEWSEVYDHHVIYIAQDSTTTFPVIIMDVGAHGNAASSARYVLPAAFDGNWHLITAVFNNKELKLYYDGQKVAENTLTGGTSVKDNTPLVVGGLCANYNEYLRDRYLGSVDDLKVYKRVLTDTEVLKIYQAGATAHDTDVLTWSGAAAGGAVEDEANWDTASNRRTVEDIYAAGSVFDMTSVQEAGVLTHDTATTLKLKDVISSGGQDEVTLQMKQGSLALNHPTAQRGLVAHFTFDDATQFGYDNVQMAAIGTIYNTSHDSTVTPAPPTSCDAPIVRGMKISTGWWHNTYMKVPGTSFGSAQGIPYGQKPVTYSLWVNPDATWQSYSSRGLGTACILLRRASDYGEWSGIYDHHVIYIVKNGTTAFPDIVMDVGNHGSAASSLRYSLPAAFDGNWHLITAVFNDTNLTLYYDGQKVGEKTLTSGVYVQNNTQLVVGGLCANDSEYLRDRYSGSVDDLKVFNVALTADEVLAEYEKRSLAAPSSVKLQLDAGTTGNLHGYCEYGSLFGAGSLAIGSTSLLKLDGTFGLSGVLTGSGSITVANLVLGGDADDYAGDFTIAENAKITVSDANGAMLNSTFGGKVVLPKKAVIEWGKRPDAGEATLTAATLIPPADFTEWTDVTGKRIRVRVVGNQLKVKIATGLFIVVM